MIAEWMGHCSIWTKNAQSPFIGHITFSPTASACRTLKKVHSYLACFFINPGNLSNRSFPLSHAKCVCIFEKAVSGIWYTCTFFGSEVVRLDHTCHSLLENSFSRPLRHCALISVGQTVHVHARKNFFQPTNLFSHQKTNIFVHYFSKRLSAAISFPVFIYCHFFLAAKLMLCPKNRRFIFVLPKRLVVSW